MIRGGCGPRRRLTRKAKQPTSISPRGGELGRKAKRRWKRSLCERKGLFNNIRLHRLARRDVVPFDLPILLPHARMAFDVSSPPMSNSIMQG